MSERTTEQKGGSDEYEWAVGADCPILTQLYTSRTRTGVPSIQSPRVVAANIDYSRKHVTNRLGDLSEIGAVEKIDTGLYRISPWGEMIIEEHYEQGEIVQIHKPDCYLTECDCKTQEEEAE